MDGQAVKLGILLLALLAIGFGVWRVYRTGKAIGKQEGIKEESEHVAKAEAKLADKLYDTDPNAGFSVQHGDSWKGIASKAELRSWVESSSGSESEAGKVHADK